MKFTTLHVQHNYTGRIPQQLETLRAPCEAPCSVICFLVFGYLALHVHLHYMNLISTRHAQHVHA
jgi:hypothetical protein